MIHIRRIRTSRSCKQEVIKTPQLVRADCEASNRVLSSPRLSAALINSLNMLVHSLTGLERILTTPIPFSCDPFLCQLACLIFASPDIPFICGPLLVSIVLSWQVLITIFFFTRSTNCHIAIPTLGGVGLGDNPWNRGSRALFASCIVMWRLMFLPRASSSSASYLPARKLKVCPPSSSTTATGSPPLASRSLWL